jgi:glycosyltransferase involved in cell wall biosynthesis
MRIHFFLPSLAGGGAERSIARIAGGLLARGADVELVLGRAAGPFLAGLEPGLRVVDLGCDSMPRAVPALARHLRQRRPQVLVSAMTHANVAAVMARALAGRGTRLVLSERVHLGSVLDGYAGWRMAATRRLLRWTYPAADLVIAVSDGVADEVVARTGLPRERVAVAPNPVIDAQLLAQAAAAPAHPWLRDAGPPVVLAAGRLVAQKDFTTLLQAFARLRAGRPARLLILGEGEQRAELQALAAAVGVAADVALPGFDDNPFAAMRTAAVFALSSRYEGLPGVLIQAMGCGCRVVATDCPSGPAEVLEGGRWGRLVPVGDAAALATALAAALDDPAPPDVRRRAADYSAEAAVSRYASLLGFAAGVSTAREST